MRPKFCKFIIGLYESIIGFLNRFLIDLFNVSHKLKLKRTVKFGNTKIEK